MNAEERQQIQERIRFYQYHPLGAATWIETHIRVMLQDPRTGAYKYYYMGELPDEPHPETGRSFYSMWQVQKQEYILPATSRDDNGRFRYHTCVACTPRGEGKSFLNCLLMLWRLCCLPKQLIILGANSQSQSKFALYEILKDLIVNSPRLLTIIGEKNIREKNIVLRDGKGAVASSIAAVSAFTGIYSNITAYAFSELFDQPSHGKFFYGLDSSRRNIMNAQGYVDSTVSEKGHPLHKLYEASNLVTGADPGILFYYRFSENGLVNDYLHPEMTEKQLMSFRAKFTTSEFAKFFLNTWDMQDQSVFQPHVIKGMHYIGASELGNHSEVLRVCKKFTKAKPEDIDYKDKQYRLSTLMPVPYSLIEDLHPARATVSDLRNLSDMYDTEWAVGVGLDLADPLKDDLSEGARSILTCVAKGLPGSRSNPDMHVGREDKVRYIYFLLHLFHIESNEIADVQFELDNLLYEYGQLQTICTERWGASELRSFAEEHEISLEYISPTYEKQRSGFNMLYNLVKTGYFKAPATAVPGAESDDILEEEMRAFRHDSNKKWYGSLTKKTKHGVQDDVMFALCWALFGMRNLTPDDFEAGGQGVFMGTVMENKDLVGKY